MKVWMLTHSGEGMPTNTILFREEHPPSTRRISEFLYSSLVGEDRDLTEKDKNYYLTKADEMAKDISANSCWTCRGGYEGADLSLVDVHDG